MAVTGQWHIAAAQSHVITPEGRGRGILSGALLGVSSVLFI